jgi:hypothetical protein
MKFQCIRLYFLLLISVLVPALIITPVAMANERHVTCGSQNYGYKYCRIYTGGRVRLVHQMSNKPCDEGETWGYDGQGVWVDKGCRADFIVDEAYGGWDSGYDRGNDYRRDHHSSSRHHQDNNIGAALGVAAGAAILGALFSAGSNSSTGNANSSYDQRHMTNIPSWAIGTFQGYDPRYHTDVELTITPSGQIYGDENGRRLAGSFDGRTLEIDGTRYAIKSSRNGLIATENNNYQNEIHYIRTR